MGTNYTEKGIRMDDEMKDLLRKVVNEMTDNGAKMTELPYTREEMVFWLRDEDRGDVADQVEKADPFRLSTSEGIVWLLTGAGFSKSERLIVQST